MEGENFLANYLEWKLLGMEIGRNLNFDVHVFSLCKKMRRKLVVSARLSKFINFKQK